jgi:hypothetical protein
MQIICTSLLFHEIQVSGLGCKPALEMLGVKVLCDCASVVFVFYCLYVYPEPVGGGSVSTQKLFSFLPAILFPSSPLWPVSASPKPLSLVKVSTADICYKLSGMVTGGEFH